MRERAMVIGADLHITSPGRGTEVCLRVPHG
jgi:signal transduction histidine kinase